MDFTRVLFVGLALILLCVGPAQGASSSSILISDSVVDTGTARRVELGLRVETSGGTGPRICADSTVTVNPQAGATGAFALVPNSVASPTVPYSCTSSSSAPCTQSFIIASTSTNPPTCTITGTFQIRFYACDNTGSASQALQTASITLNDRSVCSESLVSVATNISSFGAFADAGFSKTKSHYYINDMVYFPFHVTYEDLTISTLTFNTISVDSDTSSTVVLYSSSNTGVGNAVNLETSALTSQLETGTATMWFALQLNREEGSPFAHTPSSVTAYTFNVVFDVTYKHAKRGLHPSEGGQLYSKSTIMVHNKPVAQPRTPSSLELPANTGHILGSGILAVISSLAVLIFGF